MLATQQSDPRWAAVQARDSRFDNDFVYAVRSTGVFGRPSYPSRRPRGENVEFFAVPNEAEAAGFRACLRCRPTQQNATAEIVRNAIRLLDAKPEGLTLEQLGKKIGMSPFHLQRVFKQAVGVSPREYVHRRRMEAVRKNLANSNSGTESIYGAGFNPR